MAEPASVTAGGTSFLRLLKSAARVFGIWSFISFRAAQLATPFTHAWIANGCA